MATSAEPTRFTLRPVLVDRTIPDGAWWPVNRSLSDQLSHLFGLWPPELGRISRVLYSPPDWDDRPRKVNVDGRMVKTGSFPSDDSHQVVLSMLDGQRRTIRVIPPDTTRAEATQLLESVALGRPDAQAG